MWEVAETCGVCGSSAWTLERQICGRRYGRCRGCDLVRLVDRVAADHLSLIYNDYYSQDTPAAEVLARQLTNPTFAFRRRRLEAALGGREHRLLEIGCGDGNFLATLRAAGWTVEGAEFGATAAQAGRRHGLDVRPLDTLGAVPPGSYPFVAAYHVFEHIYEPSAWLRDVSRILEPSGLLHLQVPNYASLTRCLGREAWASWRLPEHVYFYTPPTLEATLRRAGFKVIERTTWDPWHGPGAATTTLANMARMLVTGQSPWHSATAAGPASARHAAAAAPLRTPVHAAGRRALGLGGRVLSHAEALIARGAVIDVLASRLR